MSRSVVRKPSIVHIFGWIIPEPLLIPPSVTVFPPISNVTAISLFMVSVVIIALDAAVEASSERSSVFAIAATPFSSFSTGSCIPITPVEATATVSAGIPRAFSTAPAVALHASHPSCPVHALAIPEFITTACIFLPERASSISHCTQAAFTTLLVKVPAHSQGTSQVTIAISVLP